jgi:hypothetical protein
MKARHFSFLLVLIFAAASLASCGGGTGGGGAVYDTVTLTAEYTGGNPFDSDVAQHTDATASNCGVPDLDTVTFLPDSVDFNIQSTEIPNLPEGITASDVRIQSVTITYTSASSPASPAIPDQHYALSTILTPAGTATIPVTIASQTMKSNPPLSSLVCGGGPYSYYVTVRFKGIEVNTNNERSFETNFTINFADYVD